MDANKIPADTAALGSRDGHTMPCTTRLDVIELLASAIVQLLVDHRRSAQPASTAVQLE